jgi:hypothetical protein
MSSCPTRCEGVSEAASRSAQEAVCVALGVALVVVVVVVGLAERVGVLVEDEAAGDVDVVAVLLDVVALVASGCPPPVQAAARSATVSDDTASTRGGRSRGGRALVAGLVVAGIWSNLSRSSARAEPVGSRAWQPAPDPWSSTSTPVWTTPAPSSSRPGTRHSTCGR